MTARRRTFPGAVAPLAPEGSGYPSFWNVLIIETILVTARYRTGMVDPVFDELSVGDVSRVADSTRCPWPNLVTWKIEDQGIEALQIVHVAWLGCIMQVWPPKKVHR